MIEKKPIPNFVHQFIDVTLQHDDAFRFIREHKIWKGFWKLGWVSKLSLFIALIISVQFLSIILDLFSSNGDQTSFLQSATGVISRLFSFLKESFLGSGTKYIMLIFLEVLTFHCAVQTLNILLNENVKPSFNDFMRAEKRMIAVAFRSWIYEMIAGILIGIALGFLGIESWKPAFVFVVSCYFIGFAFLDNYNEQFHIPLNESSKIIRKYAGASISIGLISYVLLMIPVVGLVIGPVLGSVAAALYFYNQGINLSEERILSIDLVDSASTKPMNN